MALWFAALGGCSRRAQEAPLGPEPLKIVSSLVRTGSASAQTSHIVRGIRLALEQSGYKAGHKQIIYKDWDDASVKRGDWDPEVEAANAARAVADKRVVIYIGPYNSGAAKVSLPILNRAHLASISPSVTYPGLTKPSGSEPFEPQIYRPSHDISFFRVAPPDDLQGRTGAAWMHQMGGRRVFVLDDLQLYGKGVADVFAQSAQAYGLEVIGHESIDPRAQEYRSLMAKIKQVKADWLYFGGTTQTNAGQIIKDARAVGLMAKIMLPDGCFEEAMIAAAGPENAEGTVFLTFGGVPPSALKGSGKDFVETFVRRFGMLPDVYAVYGFVAAQAALGAIADAEPPTRQNVLQKLKTQKQDDGPLGPWHFDANGDTTLTMMSGNVVRHGTFAFVELLGLDDDDAKHSATSMTPQSQ